ncbi:MAG TPA: transglutaminase domain-containing protein [Reyranella sp.]|nr:transglutaminase domain-containing protein [Reyranella sp.]
MRRSWHRRDILKTGLGAGALALAPRLADAQVNFSPIPKGWRTFALTTRVEPNFANKAWIPIPTFAESDWQRPGKVSWTGNAKLAERVRDPSGAEMLKVEWAADLQNPVIEVTTEVQTRNRSVRPGQGSAPALSDDERRRNLSATALLPVDGIVKQTAEGIVKGKTTDVDKAHALYEWVVENTFRNAKTVGCGVGDVSWMIKTGNFNGKCADLNALFVAMARSVGVPARDLYGIRVVPSEFGYKSLGAGSQVVTKAQHCRAEVWLAGSGWTPADPADVRKVVLEEPPTNLSMTDLKVMAARKTLFGAWEGNWLAFNDAHDVKLPGSNEQPLPFLMYPQAEDKSGAVDPYDPDAFKYKITAHELTA